MEEDSFSVMSIYNLVLIWKKIDILKKFFDQGLFMADFHNT